MAEQWKGIINAEHKGKTHRLAYSECAGVELLYSGFATVIAITRPPRPVFRGARQPVAPLLVEEAFSTVFSSN